MPQKTAFRRFFAFRLRLGRESVFAEAPAHGKKSGSRRRREIGGNHAQRESAPLRFSCEGKGVELNFMVEGKTLCRDKKSPADGFQREKYAAQNSRDVDDDG